jgi:CRP/FNR family transcriptional regulator
MFAELSRPSMTRVRAKLDVREEVCCQSEDGFLVRVLRPNEVLFRTGDERACIYRVETGAVAVYEQQLDEQRAVINFAFPGDYVGLGFLDSYTCCARAVVETGLTCLPSEAQASVVENDAKAQLKLDQAVEREFEFRRAVLVEQGRRSPLVRVAAFLVSLSRTNVQEGRDSWIVADCCPSGFVAELLGLDVETLAAVLADLERQEMIEACPRAGLRITDIEGLERLATPRYFSVLPASRRRSNPASRLV